MLLFATYRNSIKFWKKSEIKQKSRNKTYLVLKYPFSCWIFRSYRVTNFLPFISLYLQTLMIIKKNPCLYFINKLKCSIYNPKMTDQNVCLLNWNMFGIHVYVWKLNMKNYFNEFTWIYLYVKTAEIN